MYRSQSSAGGIVVRQFVVKRRDSNTNKRSSRAAMNNLCRALSLHRFDRECSPYALAAGTKALPNAGKRLAPFTTAACAAEQAGFCQSSAKTLAESVSRVSHSTASKQFASMQRTQKSRKSNLFVAMTMAFDLRRRSLTLSVAARNGIRSSFGVTLR